MWRPRIHFSVVVEGNQQWIFLFENGFRFFIKKYKIMIFLNYTISNFKTVCSVFAPTVIFVKSFLLSINKCREWNFDGKRGKRWAFWTRIYSKLEDSSEVMFPVIQTYDVSLCYKNKNKYNYVAAFNQHKWYNYD